MGSSAAAAWQRSPQEGGSSLFRNIGWTELLLIAVIILLIFGGRRIPELMRGLGSGLKEFRKGMREGAEDKPAESKPSGEKPPDQKPQ
jgi:sec-independent protein translocase protein TatA